MNIPHGLLWSFLRAVLEQGSAINNDYHAGKFTSYEEYSARMDEAARELADKLTNILKDAT